MIFCFGARRSGTYLVQRMIAAHPAVSALPSESHLISHGIAPLLERFHHGVRSSTQVGSVYADRDLMLDAVRDLCDAVFAEFLEAGTTHLLERTPLHALHARLIAELYPDAGVVHVIRDGRDVALSLVRRTQWGADSITDAAREWAECVRGGRQASGLERYVEVRYEDLLADPSRCIEGMFERLGLEPSGDAVEAALGELGVARNVEPGDRIGTGKWRQAYSRADLGAFDRVAGETVRELGYEPQLPGAAQGEPLAKDAKPARSRRSPLVRLASRARRLGGLREWQRRRADSRVEEVITSAAILDRLLTAAREGREEGILELLDPSPEAVLVGPGGQLRSESGEGTRQLLASALAGDPALRGRQLAGEILAGRPTTAAALELVLPNGRHAGRVIAIDVRDRLVKRAIVEVAEP
jgi:hypothetical protein